MKKVANIHNFIWHSAPYREWSETRTVMNLLHLQWIYYTCNEFVAGETNSLQVKQICCRCNKFVAGEIKFLKKEANIWIWIGISAPYREWSETRSVMNLLHLQRICYTCNEFVSPATNLFHLQQICYTCNVLKV